MSVKSTITLTREQAMDKAVELFCKTQRPRMLATFVNFDDDNLAGIMEFMNDKIAGGEGFENYSIQS